jgi:glycerate-2-kinase
MMHEPRDFLRAMFEAAIASADPAQCVPLCLPEQPVGRTIVVCAGKAAASMARAFEDAWIGKVMAGSALVASRSQPFAPPCILLSGGETTVTVRGQGRGGRNVEFIP